MKYTYVFLGQGRTGSTSLWRMLRDHPQIAPSVEKEFLQFDPMLSIAEYNKGFLIKNKTRVLLNGAAGSTKYCLKFVSQAKKENENVRVCCIYVLRDERIRLISYYDLVNKANERRNIQLEPVFTDGKLDYNKLKIKILYDIYLHNFLEEIERAIGRENILSLKLESIEEQQSKIYDFLKIEDMKLKFPKLNTTNRFNPTIDSLRDKIKIISLVNEIFNKTTSQISDEQIELIHERYKLT
jgi:hypothetical protein